MSLIKLTTGIILAGTILVNSASTVLAEGLTQEQKQKLEQELNIELECTSGSYGQLQTCRAKGDSKVTLEQEQRARLVYGVELHETVNAGLDANTAVAMGLIMVAGLVGAAYQIKSRTI